MTELIWEGQNLFLIKDSNELKDRYDAWCKKVNIFFRTEGLPYEDQHKLAVKMHYTDNEFSSTECHKSIQNALKSTISFMKEISEVQKIVLSEETALEIIERILKNFYMYYRAMYRLPVHKNGKLMLETLKNIQISNEYDLQRMLYSILLPIFPTIRQEVNEDNGYGGMRADIYFEDYSLIIETKCTHNSTTEKRLLEELGADSFHYRAKTIFIFIIDKNDVIKNPVAFERTFIRDKKTDGKTIRLFITQQMEW